MAKGGGGGGNPAAFTGGAPSSVPAGGMTPSSPAVTPSYASFLPASGMATPESVAAAFSAAQAQQAAMPKPQMTQVALPPRPPTTSLSPQMAFIGAMGGPGALDKIRPGWDKTTDPRQVMSIMMAGDKLRGSNNSGGRSPGRSTSGGSFGRSSSRSGGLY
jgi:hypothetical protein